MAVANIVVAVGLVLLVGICVELRTPLSSLLHTFVRYGLDKLVELSPEALRLQLHKYRAGGSPLHTDAEDTKTAVHQASDGTSTITTTAIDVHPLPDHTVHQAGEDAAIHTPSTDDQSDSATIRGEDDSVAESPSKEECTTPAEEPLRQDEELWFQDGNLILTTSTVQFRVYRGLLVAQSLVFKDMLSLPQPPEGDAVAKCAHCVPVVTIPVADSPCDLRHFLKALTGNSLFADGMHPTYHEISAIVRMAHKYQCETLLERCTKYMNSFYHDDFTLWRNDEAVFSPPRFDRIHCIGVVNLARLLGADKWLPGALMACCMLGAELFDGFLREDGTRETLSPDDLARCYLGRAKLVEANATATLKLLKQTLSPDCRRPERCEPTLRQLLSDLANVDEHRKTIFNLRWDWSWTPYVDRQDVERDLCWECYRMLGKQGRQKDIHREIYDKLPEMMGVKVGRWGQPDPAPEPEAPQDDDADDAAPAPHPPAVGFPVMPIVIQPPLPFNPPPVVPPPPPPPVVQQPPIIIPPPLPVAMPPPVQPPVNPPHMIIIPPPVVQAQAPPPQPAAAPGP